MKTDDKVVCINSFGCEDHIEEGQTYTVTNTDNEFVFLTGVQYPCEKNRFLMSNDIQVNGGI
jgi:hypothetical protein